MPTHDDLVARARATSGAPEMTLLYWTLYYREQCRILAGEIDRLRWLNRVHCSGLDAAGISPYLQSWDHRDKEHEAYLWSLAQ